MPIFWPWKICMKKNIASVYRRVNVLARGEGTQRNHNIYLPVLLELEAQARG